MSRIADKIDTLERVRQGLCAYAPGGTCDCKYGFPVDLRPGTEQTGCPELREAIGLLRQLRKVLDTGEPLLTWAEWAESKAVLDRVAERHGAMQSAGQMVAMEDPYKAGRRRGPDGG